MVAKYISNNYKMVTCLTKQTEWYCTGPEHFTINKLHKFLITKLHSNNNIN